MFFDFNLQWIVFCLLIISFCFLIGYADDTLPSTRRTIAKTCTIVLLLGFVGSCVDWHKNLCVQAEDWAHDGEFDEYSSKYPTPLYMELSTATQTCSSHRERLVCQTTGPTDLTNFDYLVFDDNADTERFTYTIDRNTCKICFVDQEGTFGCTKGLIKDHDAESESLTSGWPNSEVR